MIWIAYFVIAFIVGYFWARSVYLKGGKDIAPGNLWTALGFWIIYGLVWPVWALVLVFMTIYEFAQKHKASSLGDKIFREKKGDK